MAAIIALCVPLLASPVGDREHRLSAADIDAPGFDPSTAGTWPPKGDTSFSTLFPPVPGEKAKEGSRRHSASQELMADIDAPGFDPSTAGTWPPKGDTSFSTLFPPVPGEKAKEESSTHRSN